MNNTCQSTGWRKFKIPLLAGLVTLIMALACKVGSVSSGIPDFNPPDGSTIYVGEEISVSGLVQDCSNRLCDNDVNLTVSGAGGNCNATGENQTEHGGSCLFTPTEAGTVTVRLQWGNDTINPEETITLNAVVRPAGDGSDTGSTDGGTDGSSDGGTDGNTAAVCGNGTLEEGEACEPGGGQCGVTETCNAETCQCESDGTIAATGGTQTIIRNNPGPGCPEIPFSFPDPLIIDARNATEPIWYHVKDTGWVYSGALEQTGWTFEGDPTTLPVDEDAVGCLYCGDNVCSPDIGETAASCENDCPAVCGDGYTTHSEACDPPESVPGPLDYGDAPVTYCNDICQYTTVEPPVFDSSLCYATCTVDADCGAGFTCQGGDTCVHPQCQ